MEHPKCLSLIYYLLLIKEIEKKCCVFGSFLYAKLSPNVSNLFV